MGNGATRESESEDVYSTYINLVRSQHRVLCGFRDSSIPTQQLLDDIAVYEHIMRHDDPEKAANAYMEAMSAERDRTGEYGIPKMRIARKLGWEIKRDGGTE